MSNQNKIPFNGDLEKIVLLINYFQDQAAREKALAQELKNTDGAKSLWQTGADNMELMYVGATNLSKAHQWQKVLEDLAAAELDGTEYANVMLDSIEKKNEKEESTEKDAGKPAKEEVDETKAPNKEEKDNKPAEKPAEAPAKTEEDEDKNNDEPTKTKEADEPTKTEEDAPPADPDLKKPVMKVIHNGTSMEEIKAVKISAAISKDVAKNYFAKGLSDYVEGEVTAEDEANADFVIETKPEFNDKNERMFDINEIPKLENGKPVMDKDNNPVVEEIKIPRNVKVKRTKSGREIAYDTVVDFLVNNGVKLSGVKKYDLTDYVRGIADAYNKELKKEERKNKVATFEKMKLPTTRSSVIAPDAAKIVAVKELVKNNEFNLDVLSGALDTKETVKADDLARLKAIQKAASRRFAEGASILAVEFKDVEGMDKEFAAMYMSALMAKNAFLELENVIMTLLLDGDKNHQDHLKHKDTMMQIITAFSSSVKTNKDVIVTEKIDGKDVPVFNKWDESRVVKFIDTIITTLSKSNVKSAKLPSNSVLINPVVEKVTTPEVEAKSQARKDAKAGDKKDAKKDTKAKATEKGQKKKNPSKPAAKDNKSKAKGKQEPKGKRAPSAPKDDKKKETTTAAKAPVSKKTDKPGKPVLEVVYSANADKTVFEFEVKGSECAGKFRPKKDSKETLEQAIAKTWKGYFGRFLGEKKKAEKNKTLKVPSIPAAFASLKPTTPFDVNCTERQAS